MELITRSIDKEINLIEYKPTIKVVVEKIGSQGVQVKDDELVISHDKHKFNCEVIHSDSSNSYLRFLYVSDYKNISKPDKHGKVIRDIITAKKGYDTSFNTEYWDVEISLSERKV